MVVVLIVAVYLFDVPSLFTQSEHLEQKRFWLSAPVGIAGLYTNEYYDNITIYLVNNQRLPIEITNISLDGSNSSIFNQTPWFINSGNVGVYVLDLQDYELRGYFVNISYVFAGENLSSGSSSVLYPLERFK